MTKLSLKNKLDGNTLDLSLSELQEIPVKEIAEITKAVKLDLSCNKIRSIPDSFCSLTHLVEIDLSKNELKELPANIGKLTNLQKLDLYANQLNGLPVGMCRLKNLKWLDLKDNPLTPRLKDIAGDCLDEKQCQKCAKQVVAHLRVVASDQEREKQRKLKIQREEEAKMKAEQEKEAARIKQEKKLEKERRKAESKVQRQQQRRLQEEQQPSKEREVASGSNGTVNSEVVKPRSSSSSWFVKLFKTLLTLAVIAASFLTACFCCQKYGLVKNEEMKLVLDSAWDFLSLQVVNVTREYLHKWTDALVQLAT